MVMNNCEKGEGAYTQVLRDAATTIIRLPVFRDRSRRRAGVCVVGLCRL